MLGKTYGSQDDKIIESMNEHDEAEKFAVVETKGLAPFTQEDAEEDIKLCRDCMYRVECPILSLVNRMTVKRGDRIKADTDFSCSIFKLEDNEDTN